MTGGIVVASSAGVAVGGALTGYLAARNKRGAVIGALTHLALFGATVAFFGRSSSPLERGAYAFVGLASAVGAGYLFWKTRKRR